MADAYRLRRYTSFKPLHVSMEASDVAFLWQLLWLWVSPLLLPPDLLLLRLPALQGPQFQTFWPYMVIVVSKGLMHIPVLEPALPLRPQLVAAVALHECSRVRPRPTQHVFQQRPYMLKKTRHLPIYFIQAKKPSHRLCSVNGSTPLHTQQFFLNCARLHVCELIILLRNGIPARPANLSKAPTPKDPDACILYIVLDRYLHGLLLLLPSLFRRHSRIKHQSIVPSHSQHSTPPAHRFYLSCSRTPS